MAILKLHLHNWLVENKQTLILAWTIAAFLFFFLHSKGRLSTLAVVVLVTLCRMKGSPGKRRRKKNNISLFFLLPCLFPLSPPPLHSPVVCIQNCVYRLTASPLLPFLHLPVLSFTLSSVGGQLFGCVHTTNGGLSFTSPLWIFDPLRSPSQPKFIKEKKKKKGDFYIQITLHTCTNYSVTYNSGVVPPSPLESLGDFHLFFAFTIRHYSLSRSTGRTSIFLKIPLQQIRYFFGVCVDLI